PPPCSSLFPYTTLFRSAAAGPAFVTGGEYRPIGFVDLASPPAPGALGHVGEFPLLLAASGAEVVVICGFLTDLEFGQVVDAALRSEEHTSELQSRSDLV